MPDFRRWVLNAARRFNPAVPEEFVWTPAAHFLFRRCRRAWFCRHCLAQGGWDQMSDALNMHAYLLKYLDTVDSWMGRMTEQTLAEALQTISSVSAAEDRRYLLLEEWQTALSREWIRARDEILNEDYLSDPKRTSFCELHYAEEGYPSPLGIMNKIREHLTMFFKLAEESDLPDELAQINSAAWRLPPSFVQFRQYGIKTALRPWLYEITGKTVSGWTFQFQSSDDETEPLTNDPDNEENGLPERHFALWTAYKYPVYEAKIRKICLSPEGLIRRRIKPVPVTKEFLQQSAAPMAALLNTGDGLQMKNFPACSDPAQCLTCRFRDLCENLPDDEDLLSGNGTVNVTI